MASPFSPARLFLVAILLSSRIAGQNPARGDDTPVPRVKAGAYYFDGWTGKTYHITERLQKEFTNREPVWGWRDDDPAVMRQQIDFAADHGLSFFAFDWYWPEGSKKETPLNNALGLYLDAPNRQRVQFCLLVANHGGFRIGPADWDEVSAHWLPLFQKPEHLSVDGKPLLIFFSPGELLSSFGSAAAVNSAFLQLRQRAVEAGLPGVCIAACATPGPEHGWSDLTQLEAAGFDVLTGYNYPGAGRRGPEPKRPFQELVDGSVAIWDAFPRKSKLPYIPVVTAGWDKRPWEAADLPAQRQSVYYDDKTPEAVGDFVARAVKWLDANSSHTLKERLLLIYAWNENGEGGYLTPTKAEKAAVLEATQRALSGKPESP